MSDLAGPTLVIQHWIAATPEQVWHAWTTPDLFHQFSRRQRLLDSHPIRCSGS